MTHIELVPVTGGLTSEQVETSNIKTGAVTESKIANGQVSDAKLAAPEKEAPAKGLENTVTVGFPTPVAAIVFTINGNNSETKFKLKHGFKTLEAVVAGVWETSAEKATKPLLNAAGAGNYTYKVISDTETELIFGTAPGAGALFIVKAIG